MRGARSAFDRPGLDAAPVRQAGAGSRLRRSSDASWMSGPDAGFITGSDLLIDGGVIVEHGKPAEIFSNPREARTKAFLDQIL